MRLAKFFSVRDSKFNKLSHRLNILIIYCVVLKKIVTVLQLKRSVLDLRRVFSRTNFNHLWFENTGRPKLDTSKSVIHIFVLKLPADTSQIYVRPLELEIPQCLSNFQRLFSKRVFIHTRVQGLPI